MLVKPLRSKLRWITQHSSLLQQGLKRSAVGLETSRSQLVTQAHVFKVQQRELLLKELFKRLPLPTLIESLALEVPSVTNGIQISLGIRRSERLALAVLPAGLAVRALKAIGIQLLRKQRQRWGYVVNESLLYCHGGIAIPIH